MDFARREGRLEELRDVDLSASTLHGMPDINAGYFRLPGTKLFHDFCGQLARNLPHNFVHGSVTDIAPNGQIYELTVDRLSGSQPGRVVESTATKHSAKHIVLALGASGPPHTPSEFSASFSDANSKTDAFGRPRVLHTGDWRSLATVGTRKADTVLVIGGGLSAAQAALLAVGRGARQTLLCSRRPLVSRHYDIPLVNNWID